MSARPFRTGDAFWAPDPFHTGDPAIAGDESRPWLVVSIPETYPPHGTDYLCCALTSNRQLGANFVELTGADWADGGPPRDSWVDAETLVTMKHDWVGHYIGRVTDAKVNRARRLVRVFFG